MDLKNFLSPMSPEMRDEFAQRCMTSKGHLQNIMYGMKPCSAGLAVLIERESKRKVTRQELVADWINFWPELDRKPRKPREEKAVA